MKKSKFNLSHNASLTASMGNLIPFCTIDCLPNDSHRLSVDSFIRAQPMMAPLMHNVRFYCQWWFVPYRILWDNWTEFITGGVDNTAAPEFPTMVINPKQGSLADYFGIPVNGKDLTVSALPFRAYAEIWNARYRDEDLQTELPVSTADGDDKVTSQELQRCSWAKDYFTTARPWTQRGVQISVPVESRTQAVYATFFADVTVSPNVPSSFVKGLNSYNTTIELGFPSLQVLSSSSVLKIPSSSLVRTYYSDNKVSLYSFSDTVFQNNKAYSSLVLKFYVSEDEDLRSFNDDVTIIVNIRHEIVKSSETALLDTLTFEVKDDVYEFSGSTKALSITGYAVSNLNIRDLRLSSALQRYQERSLEYGNRYEEFIQREFGIRPRDSRIQRPEYLGGSKSVLQISEVLQTSEGETTGVGTMRGHGVAGLRQRPIRFRAPEHGIIIGIFSIRPDSVYTQGLARQWTKFSKLDYYIPELANVGMQEVFQSELYATGDNDKTIFGYAPRYEEYRKLPNRISGEFRKLLNYWNLARTFEKPPVLNSDFLKMNPSKRIFAEQTQDSFLVMLRNNIKSYRVVPKRAKNILR